MNLDVNKSLLNLNKIADENNDPQLCDFITSGYLEEQVESVKKIADLVAQLNRIGGDGLGCKPCLCETVVSFFIDGLLTQDPLSHLKCSVPLGPELVAPKGVDGDEKLQ